MSNPSYALPAISGYGNLPMYYGQQPMVSPPMSYPHLDDDETATDEEPAKIKGKGGSSCHQCKSRRNVSALTYCTSSLDKKSKKCRKKYCGHCLKKFYKEQVLTPQEAATWTCPSCRQLCTCAACRRRKDKRGGSSPISTSMSISKKRKKSATETDSDDDDLFSHYSHSSYGGPPSMYHPNGAPGYPYYPHPSYPYSSQPSSHPSLPHPSHGPPSSHPSSSYYPHHPHSSHAHYQQQFMMNSSAFENKNRWSEGDQAMNMSMLIKRYPEKVSSFLREKLYNVFDSSAFSRIFKIAHSNPIKSKIDATLARSDISKNTKFEMIAEMLRGTIPSAENKVDYITPIGSVDGDHYPAPGYNNMAHFPNNNLTNLTNLNSNLNNLSNLNSLTMNLTNDIQSNVLSMPAVSTSPLQSFVLGLSPTLQAHPDANHISLPPLSQFNDINSILLPSSMPYGTYSPLLGSKGGHNSIPHSPLFHHHESPHLRFLTNSPLLGASMTPLHTSLHHTNSDRPSIMMLGDGDRDRERDRHLDSMNIGFPMDGRDRDSMNLSVAVKLDPRDHKEK